MVRPPSIALHRLCAAAILGVCIRRLFMGMPRAGGRLQQYWVSHTGCPGPSGESGSAGS
jgi:hypothetical protein